VKLTRTAGHAQQAMARFQQAQQEKPARSADSATAPLRFRQGREIGILFGRGK